MGMDYATLGRKLEKLYPYLAKELLTVPDLDNIEQIGNLYVEYCEIQADPTTKSQETHHRTLFVAAIVKLYDPDSLSYKKNMLSGLRKKLSDTLQCKPTSISDTLQNVRNYIDIYPSFSNELAYIYCQLKMYANANDKDRPEKLQDSRRKEQGDNQ